MIMNKHLNGWVISYNPIIISSSSSSSSSKCILIDKLLFVMYKL